DDAVKEGFHTDFISYSVSSAGDVDVPVPVSAYLVNGDFDLGAAFDDGVKKPLEIPIDKPTSFLFLRDKPDPSQPVQVLYNPADVDGDGKYDQGPDGGKNDTL